MIMMGRRHDHQRTVLRRHAFAFFLGIWVGALSWAATPVEAVASPLLEWSKLPSLPNEHGLAGAYAGTSSGALVVAGGANFPDGRPWDGAEKVWHDQIYILPSPDGQWEVADTRLPHPMAYGVAVTWENQLISVGGGNGERHFGDVISIEWTENGIQIRELPSLPQPCAFMAGAIANDTLYIVGGQRSPEATEAMKTFWALDLTASRADQQWRSLDPWPGPARILPVAGSMNGAFYLFSGAQLVPKG